MNFEGQAIPLSPDDVARAARSLDIEEAALRAVLEVETRGSGFDAEGRPKMLFEPHRFYALLAGELRAKAVASGLAYARWGMKPYPKDSYPRIDEAIALGSESLALQSASWGLGQVMGDQYKNLGYARVQDMVLDACESEAKQLDQMCRFITFHGLVEALKNKDWARFARGYNGAAYAKNAYDKKLAKAYLKWSKLKRSPIQKLDHGLTPAEINAIQTRLDAIGFHEVGKADGVWGSRTTGALAAFQHERELPTTGEMDEATKALFWQDYERPVSAERSEATTVEGSRTVAMAGVMKGLGGGTVGLAAVGPVLDKVETARGYYDRISTALDPLAPVLAFLAGHPLLIVAAAGGVLTLAGVLIHNFRVADHREGKLS